MSAKSMTKSLELAHRYRWSAVIITTLVSIACIWLIAADMLMQTRIGIRFISSVTTSIGISPVADHTLRGVLGVWPATGAMHLAVVLIALLTFAVSIYAFVGAGKGWLERLNDSAKLPAAAVASASLIAALIVVAIVATAFEPLGIWRGETLAGAQHHAAAMTGANTVNFTPLPMVENLRVSNHFWLSAGLLLVLWPLMYAAVRLYLKSVQRRWDAADRFWATGALSYWLFVFSGITLLVSGMMQSTLVGFDGDYWATGTYTGMAVAIGCLLWTCIPISSLLFVSQSHLRRKAGECLACGYDLRGSTGACPECGHAREASAAPQTRVVD